MMFFECLPTCQPHFYGPVLSVNSEHLPAASWDLIPSSLPRRTPGLEADLGSVAVAEGHHGRRERFETIPDGV